MIRISNFSSRNSNDNETGFEPGSDAGGSPHAAVERMMAVLVHRGPDDKGVADFELKNAAGKDSQDEIQISFGNTRLAIIDLSAAGHQPMQDESTGLTITYNGEVYNFRELRAELVEEFGSWRSNSDTEVVLRAYRKWGTGAFEKIRGMFAVAILDQRRGELVLARDRFGIKPLYYSTIIKGLHHRDTENTEVAQRTKFAIRNPKSEIRGFIFASEVRALMASGIVPRKLNREGLASYLNSGSVQAPLTIIKDVWSLMPGTYLRVRAVDGRLKIEERGYLSNQKSNVQSLSSGSQCSEFSGEIQSSNPQTRISDFGLCTADQDVPCSRSDAVALVREKLTDSVRAHLTSDVPLGVFLSGGMDSSALVALINNVVSEAPKTFSVVFDEQEFSEAPHSRLIAEQFKTDHKEVRLTEECLLEMLPQAIAALDQPTMDGINTYVVSRAVKEAGITVALSGLGGDELFAGYPTFRRALRMRTFSNLSKRIFSSASGIANKSPSASVAQKKFWQLAASDGSPEAVYAITRQLFASDIIQSLLGNLYQTNAESRHNPQFAIRNSQSAILQDPVNEISRLELRGYMADTLLRDTDCMSMAHSLEVRVPFVDAKIVPYVLSLPGKWKMNGFNRSRPKPLLADAVSDLLPDELLQRPKMGFTLPFERWMRSRLQQEISSVLEDETSLSAAGLNPDGVASIWQRFLRTSSGVGWSRPWALYVLVKWCGINGIRI